MKTNPAKSYDFTAIEKEISAHWDANEKEIVSKTIAHDKNRELFSWVEGPPTANAPPGLHHVEVRVFKDLYCRFKYMQGYSVPRKGGWDCHGLPVEVQVEKKLGLKTKKDVIKYGEEKFIEACKKDVFTFVKDWERVTKKLGFWIDFDNAYMTLSKDYMESVWWSLKELHKKDLLYKGHKVVPYCPRCETPLSSHEVALGYKDVTDDAITVKFKLKNEDKHLLAWTTTPWTLLSNLALAVNKDIDYVTVEVKGEKLVLAKDLKDKYFKDEKILEEFKGDKLVGKEYEPIYNYMKEELAEQKDKKSFIIVHADYVSVEDGTGIVHQAPAFGEEDYQTCKENSIAFINPVEKDGSFNEKVTLYKGRFVKDADKDIIKELEKRKLLIKEEEYLHAYPFCWRCDTPLLYYAMDSWFVSVNKHADKLIKHNEKINWYPNHIKKGRFGNWLEGAKDWAISRNKFWGTPLPIWVCEECEAQKAIGSIKELEELTGKKVDDLHKPIVDPLTFKCEKCKGTMRRTSEVIDCWYDSGAAPFAQYHYPFSKEGTEMFKKSAPYDFIAEAIDQTRGWFYTLHVIGVLLFDDVAYKSCAVGGLLCDDKGEKMSKSKGNVVDPEEMFDKVGVDAVRMLMCSYPLGEQIRFGMKPMEETINPFFNTLWNSYYFASTYLIQQGLTGEEKSSLETEDEWMISKTNELIKEVTEHLEKHEYNQCVSKLQGFVVEDFSRWYIKLVRDRTNDKDKALAYTFRYVLENVAKLLAPFTPYIAEKIYKEFTGKFSVHLEEWPKPGKINEKLNTDMKLAREVVQGILSARDQGNTGVRWPLREVLIELDADLAAKETLENTKKALETLKETIYKHTNIKGAKIIERFDKVKYKAKPDYRSIGEDFGTSTGDILNELKKSEEENIIKNVIHGKQYKVKVAGKTFGLEKKHFVVEKEVEKPWVAAPFKFGTIYINTELDKELLQEGYAREIARRVQALRKEAGLEKQDRIHLHIQPSSEHDVDLEKHLQEMKEKIGADTITISMKSPDKEYKHRSVSKIKGNEYSIMLNKK